MKRGSSPSTKPLAPQRKHIPPLLEFAVFHLRPLGMVIEQEHFFRGRVKVEPHAIAQELGLVTLKHASLEQVARVFERQAFELGKITRGLRDWRCLAHG